MINSGFADTVSGYIIALAEHARHSENAIYVMLAVLYIITNLFTELITNNAAAALAFPLAIGISNQMGCDPMPFFICICFAASASFSTPIGYQTNLIVQGIGEQPVKQYPHFVHVGLGSTYGKLIDKALQMHRLDVCQFHVHQIVWEFSCEQFKLMV